MKSKICSSEYVRTVSRGKSWIPAFLSLGFLPGISCCTALVVGTGSGPVYAGSASSAL